ncbi:MAG TPA: T9SS type A sorting domain-containing protein [Saprospiraceae bacterium]|nr:T9SS type A sorting domain-containing protein [Saprospiraceae bacterium]
MKKKATLKATILIGHLTSSVLLMLLLFMNSLSAQGWQRSFGGDSPEEGWAVMEDIDGGYLLLGSGIDPDGDSDQDVFLVKLDIDGTLVWSTYFDNGDNQQPKSIARLVDGNYLLVGSIDGNNGIDDVELIKISPQGELIWARTYGGDVSEVANDVVALEDGGFAIVGENDAGTDIESDILVVRFDALGNARWQKTIGTQRSDVGNGIVRLGDGFAVVGDSKNEIGFDNDIVLYRLDAQGETVWDVRIANNFLEEGRDIVATLDGGLAIAGTINNSPDAFVAKFDADGNQRWSRTLGNETDEEIANSVTQLADGSLVIAGIRVLSDGINADIFVAKLDGEGNQIWERNLGRSDYLDEVRSIVPTLDGGFALAGYAAPGLTFENDMVLVKTDALGNTLTNEIKGTVYQDLDGACDLDEEESGLSNWVVIARGETRNYYGTTDENGQYAITVDTGAYIVDILPENRYWETCQENGYPIVIDSFYDTLTVDMAAVATVECPYLEVDISAPFLVRCDNIVYTVEYCNLGTADAIDAKVEVLLDNQLSFESSAIPVVQNGSLLRFDLGAIPAGECGRFQFTTQSSCDGTTQSKAVSVEATITPDTLCITEDAGWDRSDIRVTAECQPDEILFQIKNIGKNSMDVSRGVVVVENEIILNTGEYQLAQAQDTSIRISFADGRQPGATYRVIANQAKEHPFKAFATAAVEGCDAEDGNFATGFVTQFPEDDEEPTRSKDVQVIIDSLPSVELRGYPKGYRGGIIAQETDLTYKFILSNTGEELVDRIVIRDTLSGFLDISTLEMGASSHPYSFEVYNQGILKITFDDIQLRPDGASDNTDYAFVEFRISQNPGNPVGTIIANRASIFYDYQQPVLSNRVEHTVGQYPDFVEIVVDTDNPVNPQARLNIYPNPFLSEVNIEVIGETRWRQLKFRVFDLQGRVIDQQVYTQNRFVYRRHPQLKTGVYVFQLEADGALIGSGKLLVR